MKRKLGLLLLDIDDWFAKRKIYYSFFSKNDNHVNFICKLAFKLLL
jgi:hypothetical protein